MAQATLSNVTTETLPRAVRLPWLTSTVVASASLLLLALALPIFRGHVYVADDLGAFHLPARAFYADALANGEAFDWWPALFGGFYLTGEGQAGLYHPLHLALYAGLPLPWAFNLEVVLSYPWMFLGMYLWLRRRVGRMDAALFGALAFTFCGFNLLHLPHVNAIAVVAQMPWLLLAIDIAVCDRRPRWRTAAMAAISLLTASQLLLGYPQYVWFSLLVEAGYAWWLLRSGPQILPVAEVMRHRVRGLPNSHEFGYGDSLAPNRAKLALTLACAVTVGFLLAGVQLLPTLDMLSTSTRQDAGVSFAEWGSLHPWNVLQLVAPYLFESRVVGRNTHELGLYAGCVPLALCAWLWIRRGELGVLRPLVVAATGLAIVALWLAFGEYGFLYRLQTWLPVVGKFRFPCRMIVLFQLAMAVLAAVAVALLATRHPARLPIAAKRYGLLWMLFGASVVVAMVAVLAWPEHVATWPAVIAGPLLVATAALLVWLADRNSRAALAALTVLAAIDLGVYGMSYSVLGRTQPLDDFVARQPAPPQGNSARMLAEAPADLKRGERVGNEALLSGWSRIDGYAGLEPARRLDYRQPNALRVAGVEPATSPDSRLAASSRGRAPLPAVRLVAHVRESSSSAREIATIDPSMTALVEPGFNSRHTLTDPVGGVSIVAQGPGRIVLQAECDAPNLVVVNQSWHSGWHARLDGQPIAVERLYGDFVGCVVPAGDHRVEFEFHPASLRNGLIVSAAGLVCLFLGTAWIARGNRPPLRDEECVR